jgi:hypothetical protein
MNERGGLLAYLVNQKKGLLLLVDLLEEVRRNFLYMLGQFGGTKFKVLTHCINPLGLIEYLKSKDSSIKA